jgi:hypothetical protein
MKIQATAVGARFAEIKPGTFFCALRSEKLFAIAVSAGTDKGALVFSNNPHQPGTPWLAPKGLTGDHLAAFPNAILKAEWLFADKPDGEIPFGALLCSDGKFFMRAAEPGGFVVTFNLETGCIEDVPSGKALLVYSCWQIGHQASDRFEPLFTFPV